MIRLNNIKLPLDYSDIYIKEVAAKELRIPKEAIKNVALFRRSIDARHKNDVHFISTIDVNLITNESKAISKCKSKNAQIINEYKYELPKCNKLKYRPVVVGAGPAGLFAALILAQSGAKPILIERGKDVDARTKNVLSFWNGDALQTESNVQFGEGGAGTFSDGKLNTGTKDHRARKVLIEFVRHGAPQEILYNARPHIGTDKLKDTVKNLRNEIIDLGAQVMFSTKLVGIKQKDGRVCRIIIESVKDNTVTQDIIETDNVVLAVGHSARDTFEMIKKAGILIEPKAFSVGARIEHLREKIDISQYGKFAGHKLLGAASYKMNVHLKSGRGVYTFCMCPGGKVVAAQSEENTIVTNGMSEFSRNDINSNSALLVSVTPDDFKSDDVLSGMYFQREIERKAFKVTGESYNAPVQMVGDFLNNKCSNAFGEVLPSYKPGTAFAKLDEYLPGFVCESMRQAIVMMENKLTGFSHSDALLTGSETRSSSPIRILRNQDMQSLTLKGLYPCGEGAGYAGGIISAAVDGIKCAEKILTE